MAEKDTPGPSLELPSLFDRKKKRRSTNDDTDAPSQGGADSSAPSPEAAEDTRVLDPAPTREHAPARESAAAPAPAPAREPAPAPAPAATTAPVSAPAPVAAPTTTPATTPASTSPAASTGGAGPSGTTRQDHAPVDAEHRQPGEDADEQGRGGPSMPSLPELGAAVAALVVGALVGLLGVVLTFVGLQGCELVTGTDSCGGPGLLVLLAIVVAMVLAGAAVLRLFTVPDAGSVSFLGVGLLMVIVLVLLIDSLTSPVMIVVIPALTAGCFALARWVTTQLGDDVTADR